MRLTLTSSLLLAAWLFVAPSLRAVEIYASGNTGELYRIDTDAGFSVTLLGTAAPAGNFLGGLDFSDGGVLFGASSTATARLYTVSTTDGSLTDVGPIDAGFLFEGGLEFDPTDGTLYAVNVGGSANPSLITIDPTTGLGTSLGEIGGGSHDFLGLAFDAAGDLYGVDRVTSALWRIDKTNPAGPDTQQVGPSFGGGIAIGAGGMATDANGTVYCYTGDSRHLFTVDLTTGLPTILTQFAASDPLFLALAIDASTPLGDTFVRGDANLDGQIDISDSVFVLAGLFIPGAPAPACLDAADANDDGGFDVSDAVFGLASLFIPGSPPVPAPHPDCGADPTSDALDCSTSTCP